MLHLLIIQMLCISVETLTIITVSSLISVKLTALGLFKLQPGLANLYNNGFNVRWVLTNCSRLYKIAFVILPYLLKQFFNVTI